VSEYDIEGLVKSENVEQFPEGITTITRRSAYDDLLNEAKHTVKKLEFKSEKRAKNVVLAIRTKLGKMKKDDPLKALFVGRQGSTVYVGPKAKLPKPPPPPKPFVHPHPP